MGLRRWLFVAVLVLSTRAVSAQSPAAESTLEFSRDIRPILAEHCLRCHGPDKAEGKLNFADRQSATNKSKNGDAAIVPGQPAASELIRRVTSADSDERMPPEGKPLSAEQIEKLRRWITAGADYQLHWAYRSLIAPTPPPVKQSAWVRQSHRCVRAGAIGNSAHRARCRSLACHADQTPASGSAGLLPMPDEVDAFAKDDSPQAYEQLVDRLLASPHFGERWGRHWLDMARYADSDGYEKDSARPDAFVFRDWVIGALNRDLPFDQFTIEQLAGDLLPGANASQKIATAFNRQTLTNKEGGVDQEEYRVAAIFDRTDTLGAVWLGLTVGCARCHNHKYDEIAQREYYQLFAFFNDADEASAPLPVKAGDLAALEAELQPLEEALGTRRRELAPAELRWEEEQRTKLESPANKPLKFEPLEFAAVTAASGTLFERQTDGSYRVAPPAATAQPTDAVQPASGAVAFPGEAKPVGALPDTDRYTLTAPSVPPEITGFRLEAIPDASLPKKGSGRATSGNFVVTRWQAFVIDAAGKQLRAVPLRHAAADFQQQGFKAADAIADSPNKKNGWAVGSKVDAGHNLQVRTAVPLVLEKDERLQLVIDQDYGGAHMLGRFRVQVITGDALALDLPAEVALALRMYPEKRVDQTQELLFNHFASQDETFGKLKQLIEAAPARHNSQSMQVRILTTALRKRTTHRFDRGDFLSPAEEVRPGTLHVLPSLAVEPAALISTDSAAGAQRATRLELARWLVSRENPLTPRVVANQVWSRLFGAGLVRTASDFGVRGDVPSHPELLDWLAATYQRDLAWSTKAFIRTIVTSSTYRQASTHRPELVDRDPQNTLLTRQNRLRVEGELVRDLALQAGGLLSPKIGGPSVFPPMPADLAKLSYANSFSWTDSVGEDRYRRGMYTFFKRTVPHPTLMTFDCPDANVTCINRTVSNTPLQALTLLNNESFVEAAQSLAKRLLVESGGTDDQRLGRAVQVCLCRPATSEELDRLDDLLDSARQYYKANPEAADAMIGRYAQPTAANAEAAAWAATVRVLLNLDEFLTRE